MSDPTRERFIAGFRAAPPEERGRMMLFMVGYATAYTAVNGGLAAGLAVSAARIWRRRDRGWGAAVRTGGCWRTVAGFSVASAALSVVRKSVVKRITDPP
jgi:hypothetical protein